MQIQANVLGEKVIRPKVTETTALGVAFLAGLALGFWKDRDELQKIWKEDKIFNPQEDEKNNPMIELWDDRIKKILTN